MTPRVAIDFETFYEDGVYSLKQIDPWSYVHDDRFECYQVAIVGDGIEYVGPVEGAPWRSIAGMEWWSHNATFDRLVKMRLDALANVVGVPMALSKPSAWHCTANLSCYLQAPRNLQGAAKQLLGKDISKDYRRVTNGKHFDDLTPAEQEQVRQSGLSDARSCYEIATKYGDLWPDKEKRLAEMTYQALIYGANIDWPLHAEFLEKLREIRWKSLHSIPWIPANWEELPEKKRPAPLSPKHLAAYCAVNDLPVLTSRAKDNEECQEWLEEHGADHPVIAHLRDFTTANTRIKRLETLAAMKRPDGTVPVYAKMYSAHTGRWGGDRGFNWFNLDNNPPFGLDMRALLIPRPGHKFIDADKSQIEPRVLAWGARNTPFLDSVAAGVSPYEAHARTTMGWTGGELKKENPKLYALAKGRCLACGYGAGWKKFITMIERYGIPPATVLADPLEPGDTAEFREYLEWCAEKNGGAADLAKFNRLIAHDDPLAKLWINAWKQVKNFRETETHTTRFWTRLENAMKAAAKTDHKFELELPSGRTMHYWNVHSHDGSVTAQVDRGGKRDHYYGGKLAENFSQALAREVFAEDLLALDAAGYRIILHVYDQVLIEVPAEDAEQELPKVLDIMGRTPAWIPGLPLAAEGKITEKFTK